MDEEKEEELIQKDESLLELNQELDFLIAELQKIYN